MSIKTLLVGGLSTALAVTAFGCASAPTTSTSTQETLSAIDQAQMQPERSIMSIADLKTNLPAQISEADAARMLVEIDPNKIVTDGNYAVQQFRSRGIGFGLGHRGGFRGLSRGFYGGYHRYGGLSRFRYFNYRNNYYPYYYNAGFYRPYVFRSYYNYLSPYNNAYYPYTCW